MNQAQAQAQAPDLKIKSTYFKHNPSTDRYVCVVRLTNGFEVEGSPQSSKTLASDQVMAQVKMLFDFHYYCLKTDSFCTPPPTDESADEEWIVERWYRSGG